MIEKCKVLKKRKVGGSFLTRSKKPKIMRGLDKFLILILILSIIGSFLFIMPEYVVQTIGQTGVVSNQTVEQAQQKAAQIRNTGWGIAMILLILFLVGAIIAYTRGR